MTKTFPIFLNNASVSNTPVHVWTFEDFTEEDVLGETALANKPESCLVM